MTFTNAVRAQLRLALHTPAVWFLTALSVLPWLFTIIVVRAAQRSYDPDILIELGPDLLISDAGGIICMALGAVWGIMLWRDEPPSKRFYHWSLPVDPSAHDLARVAARAVVLSVALAVYFLVGGVMLKAMDVPMRLDVVGAVPFVSAYVAGLIGYLFGATYSTALQRPAEYLLGTVLLIQAAWFAAFVYDATGAQHAFEGVMRPWGLIGAVTNAGFAANLRYQIGGRDAAIFLSGRPTAGPLLLWLTIALAALVAASMWNRGRAR